MQIDRREFLRRNTVLAAVAMPAWGAAARARAAAPGALEGGSGDKLRLGVIGVGGRARGLMGWGMEHPAVTVSHVCDVNRQNLEHAAAAVREKTATDPLRSIDFRRVLDDQKVDAVIVATPHHWHVPIAARALLAGKHVYLEKPASHVFREGRVLVEAEKRSGRLFQHGTQMRSSEVTAAAGKVLASGILGEIKMAKAWGAEPRSNHPAPAADTQPPEWLDYDRWLGPAPARPFNPNRFRRWNAYRDYGNGEIGGDGIHDIDMARWGLGVTTHPVRVVAHGSRIHVRGESDFPDNMMVSYQYAEGKVLTYENRNFAPYGMHGWDNGNIFYGTDGYMVFSRRGYFQTYLGAKEEKGPGMRGGAGNRENVHGFIDCVREGRPTNAGAGVAHLSCALVHLGEVAYRSGRTIRFDPVGERILDDGEADALLTKAYRAPWTLETT